MADGYILHPAMWHVRDIDFARWLAPCNVDVALESWQWIHQVAAPCSVTREMPLNSPGGSTLQCGRWLWADMPLKRPPYWNSTSGFDFDHITTSLRNFVQIGPLSAEKKMMSCRFSRWRISAILGFRDPIMGSLKSPCTTSCRSSIDTIALNCLVFEKIAVFPFWRQTDEQMDSTDALSRSRCCKQQLNKHTIRLYACRTSVPSIPRLHLSAMGCLAVHWW